MKRLGFCLLFIPLFAACESDPITLRSGDTHLRLSSSCEELTEVFTRQISERALLNVETDLVAGADESASNDSVVGETNIQVSGVDELDSMKADGDFIYRLSDEELIVLRRNPVEQAGVIQSIDLGDGPQPISSEVSYPYSVGEGKTGLFLTSDQLMVVDADSRGVLLHVFDRLETGMLSLSTRRSLDGQLQGARLIDDQVYLFTSKGVRGYVSTYDAEPFVSPEIDGLRMQASSEELDIQSLLHKTRSLEEENTVCECTDVFLEPAVLERAVDDPVFWNAPSNLICVSSVNIQHLENEPKAKCVAASNASQIYVSTSNAFVASRGWSFETPIHQFRLSESPEYVGTVNVPGYINNQFSMDEFDGHFRVASTYRDDLDEDIQRWMPSSNGVFVYELVEGDPDLVGSVEGFGDGERIYAARFMSDKAFVVTFEQTDPLFSIDLSDPTSPELKGELEIPGFSTYLHPFEEGYLLSIGQSGNAFGATSQVALSLFDVRDLTAPTLLFREEIGTDYSSSEAMYDHHAFRFIPENGLLVLPVATYEDWTDWKEGFYIYQTSLEDGFSLLGTSLFPQESPYAWHGASARSFYKNGVISMVGGGELVLRSEDHLDSDLVRVDAE